MFHLCSGWAGGQYRPHSAKALEASHGLNVLAGDLHDFLVGLSVDGVIADGAAQLDRLAGLLRLQKGIDVDGHVRFGQVLAMQPAASDRIGHIRAELAVGRAGVYIGAAGPVAQRIDFCCRVQLLDVSLRRVALADDEPVIVEDVLAVERMGGVDVAGNRRERLLLVRERGHP